MITRRQRLILAPFRCPQNFDADQLQVKCYPIRSVFEKETKHERQQELTGGVNMACSFWFSSISILQHSLPASTLGMAKAASPPFKSCPRRAHFLLERVAESQSRPSYRPSPVVAQHAWIYHCRWRRPCRPNLSVISAADMALGRSYGAWRGSSDEGLGAA